jgi:hypothetical protein
VTDLDNDAYVWECRNGHLQAATELQMHSSYIRPVCSLCNAALVKKIRPWVGEKEPQFGLAETNRPDSTFLRRWKLWLLMLVIWGLALAIIFWSARY